MSQLAARTRRCLVEPELRPSAVAILLAEQAGITRQLWVPLIVRPADAPTHSGQIALPGGGVHPGDGSLGATAQREAFEELGVPTTTIDVLGLLDDVPTPAGYCITPVLCAFSPHPFAPDAREVASYFWAPVSLFADHAAAEFLGEREYRGVTYQMRAYHWQGHRIWGATARILEQVAQLVTS
ncbi:MAG: CoA pyrophosphatase [Myxococcales bacterium]|nr:CoA pyrophosphatase [Myxococcales bacterium]